MGAQSPAVGSLSLEACRWKPVAGSLSLEACLRSPASVPPPLYACPPSALSFLSPWWLQRPLTLSSSLWRRLARQSRPMTFCAGKSCPCAPPLSAAQRHRSSAHGAHAVAVAVSTRQRACALQPGRAGANCAKGQLHHHLAEPHDPLSLLVVPLARVGPHPGGRRAAL